MGLMRNSVTIDTSSFTQVYLVNAQSNILKALEHCLKAERYCEDDIFCLKISFLNRFGPLTYSGFHYVIFVLYLL